MNADTYQLKCSCGWTHEASTRPSATKWKLWHRRQFLKSGQRLSETGHDVTITKVQNMGVDNA